MTTISIIVPVYKVEPYLRRCVDSILGQTFTDFELILVDDGSPDNCPAICDEYAQQDRRVHVIHQENGGLSAARNAGIDWAFSNSESQWLSFVDSDDWVHPEYLERLLDAALENKVSVSICGYAKTEGEDPEISAEKLTPELWSTEDFFVEHNVNAIVAWGKLYRKECFDSIRYPVGRIHEDEFTTYKILFQLNEVVVIPAGMYCYFQNENGIMGRGFSLERLNRIWALEEQHFFFESIGRVDLIRITEKKMLGTYYYQIIALRKFPEYSRIQKLLIHKLYKLVMSRCGDGEFNPAPYRDVLPCFTLPVWYFKRLILILRQEGLRKTFIRLWRKLLCRKLV